MLAITGHICVVMVYSLDTARYDIQYDRLTKSMIIQITALFMTDAIMTTMRTQE